MVFPDRLNAHHVSVPCLGLLSCRSWLVQPSVELLQPYALSPITKLIGIIDFLYLIRSRKTERCRTCKTNEHHFSRRLFAQRLFRRSFRKFPTQLPPARPAGSETFSISPILSTFFGDNLSANPSIQVKN